MIFDQRKAAKIWFKDDFDLNTVKTWPELLDGVKDYLKGGIKFKSVLQYRAYIYRKHGKEITRNTVRNWIREGHIDGVYMPSFEGQTKYLVIMSVKSEEFKPGTLYRDRFKK